MTTRHEDSRFFMVYHFICLDSILANEKFLTLMNRVILGS